MVVVWGIFLQFYHKDCFQWLYEDNHLCHNHAPMNFEEWNKAQVLQHCIQPLPPEVNKNRTNEKLTAKFWIWRSCECSYCMVHIFFTVVLYDATKIILPTWSIYSCCYWAMKSQNIFHFLFITYHTWISNKFELRSSKERNLLS